MPRLFAGLSIANVLLLLGAALTGLFSTRFGPDRHVLLAVLTLLLSCLVQVVAFTYLTVTGKMIGQAVHLARLDAGRFQEVRRLKRSFTFCLGVLFVPILLVTASGASAWRSGEASVIHWLAAGMILAVHPWVFWRELRIIVRNAELLGDILARYDEVRPSKAGDMGSYR